MTEVTTLPVRIREKGGRGSARAARREGWVPAIIYGGKDEPRMIDVNQNELHKQWFQGGFMKKLFKLSTGEKEQLVLPRDVQLHPVSDWPLHLDFQRVDDSTKAKVFVTVNFLNADTSVGLKRGGVLNVVRHEVEVLAPVMSIPEAFEIDLADADIGDSIHADVVELPKGVEFTIDRNFTIATIAAPSGGVKDDAEGEGEEGEGEGEE